MLRGILGSLGPSSLEKIFLLILKTLKKSLLDHGHSLSANDATLDFPSLSSPVCIFVFASDAPFSWVMF